MLPKLSNPRESLSSRLTRNASETLTAVMYNTPVIGSALANIDALMSILTDNVKTRDQPPTLNFGQGFKELSDKLHHLEGVIIKFTVPHKINTEKMVDSLHKLVTNQLTKDVFTIEQRKTFDFIKDVLALKIDRLIESQTAIFNAITNNNDDDPEDPPPGAEATNDNKFAFENITDAIAKFSKNLDESIFSLREEIDSLKVAMQKPVVDITARSYYDESLKRLAQLVYIQASILDIMESQQKRAVNDSNLNEEEFFTPSSNSNGPKLLTGPKISSTTNALDPLEPESNTPQTSAIGQVLGTAVAAGAGVVGGGMAAKGIGGFLGKLFGKGGGAVAGEGAAKLAAPASKGIFSALGKGAVGKFGKFVPFVGGAIGLGLGAAAINDYLQKKDYAGAGIEALSTGINTVGSFIPGANLLTAGISTGISGLNALRGDDWAKTHATVTNGKIQDSSFLSHMNSAKMGVVESTSTTRPIIITQQAPPPQPIVMSTTQGSSSGGGMMIIERARSVTDLAHELAPTFSMLRAF